MTEQLSTSNVETKIHLPNKKLVGLKTIKESTKLPQPTGWRILVLPFRIDEKTKGGVLLGQEAVDRQQVASQCGNVLALWIWR